MTAAILPLAAQGVVGPFDYHSLSAAPCRIIDTRFPAQAPGLQAGVPRTVDVAGVCGVPEEAVAVSLNVTAILPTASGFLSLYPSDAVVTPDPESPSIPVASLPYQTGLNRAKVLLVGVGADGNMTANITAGQAHLVIDVSGYFLGAKAVADTATVNEDAAATTINVLANDLNPNSDTLSISAVTQPANGTVVITNAGADLTYQPNPDYCNDPPGTTLDTFTYTLGPNGTIGTVSVTVTCQNDAPTDIALDSTDVQEGQPAGTPVGNFSTTDVDTGDTFTYTLVTGTGDTDNASFQIVGNQLQTAAVLDLETQASYSIRVRSTDAGGLFFEKVFTITLGDTNDAPTDIALTPSSVQENQPVGTTVGTLSTTDPDAGDTHTYTLVTGVGDTDNASFTIVGNQLQTTAVFDLETKSSYSIRVRSTDSGSLFFEKVFTITVTNANEAPTDIALSASTVAEGQPSGTVIGTFSTTDIDVGDTFTYTLVAGVGSTDNASFAISGNQLQTAAVLDFETKSSYSIRVRSTDAGGLFFEKVFTITATDANEGPTDIALSSTSVAEGQASGTTVGTFSTTDPDTGDTFTYTLVAGVGSTDNASFTISGNQIQTAAVFDFETKSSYSIRVRSTDSGGLFFEKVFTITVSNVNEQPTDIALSPSSVNENQVSGTTVGTFSTTDPDTGDTFTYTLVAGAGSTDNGSFTISGNQLQTAAVFDFETKSSYSIRVRSTDAGGLFFEKAFTITVNNLNEAPTDIALSNATVAEAQASGTAVGNFSTTDPDVGDTFTYTLVAGAGSTDNGSFTIVGNQLRTAAVLDFETKSSYSIRVRSTDSGGLFFEKVFTITVTNVNEQPTDITLSNATVAEAQASGTAVGSFSTTDPDVGDTFTYTLVAGVGSTDNASFQIVGNQLQTAAVFDFETKSSYSIRVRSTDSGGLFFEKVFTISVANVNEQPTDIALSNATVAENQASGTAVGTFSTTDPDIGDTFTYTLVAGTGSTDNASFAIVGNQLRTAAIFDFETKSSYSIRVRSTDSGGLFFEKVFTITVTNLNEAPTDIALSPSAVDENQPSGTAVGNFSTIDPDTGDTFTYTLVAGAGSTDNASFAIVGSQLQTAAMFDFETKNSYSIRVRSTDSGGLFFEKVFTIAVNNVPEAPVAGPDGFDSVSNTFLEVDATSSDPEPKVYFNGNLLTNDFDPDGPTTLTAALSSASPGAVVTVNSDGTFTYLPPAGKTGTDTFTYTVSDGLLTSAPGTVTITFKHRVWYVKNDHPDGGLGRSTDPFDTLVEAETASAANDTIYVFRGDGTVAKQNNGIALKNGQRLIGEGVALSVPVSLNGGPASTQLRAVGAQPLIHNNTDDAGEDNGVVVSATAASLTGIEIRGLSIQGRDNAIDVTATGANNAGVTIQDNVIASDPVNGLEGVDVNANSTGTVTISIHDNTLGARGNAIDITRTNGTVFITAFDDNLVSGNTAGSGIVVTGPAIFDSNTATGALDLVPGGVTMIGQSGNGVGGGGLVLSSVSGNLSFTDLDIYSDGSAGGLVVTGTGAFTGATGTQLTVPAGVSTLDSNGGPAVNINNVSVSLPLGFLRSTNSTTTGVSLVNAFGGVGSTAFSASSGQISDPVGASGTALNISGGNGNITLGIPITNNSGNAVAITGRTSDNISFTGAINETGSGISLTSNTGATMSFRGGLAASTGANPAFAATGGGTIEVCDDNPCSPGSTGALVNTLATTAATALNVSNTNISSNNLEFLSISAGGAAKGIILNSTGTAAGNGGLKVVGSGSTDGSGGTIQNISGRGGEFITTKALLLKNMNFTNANTTDGGTCTDLSTTACNAAIYLNAVATATLDNINVTGTTTQQAINGISVSNFTLSNSTLANCGSSGGVEEGCIKMRELTGTCSITDSDLSFPGADVAEIVNTAGPALTLNVNNSTFRDSQSSSAGNTGLQVRSEGTANVVLNVTNSNFLRIRTVGLHATAINTASNDVDVTTSTFDPGTGTMIGLDLDADQTGNLVFNVQGNTKIYSRNGPAVNVFGDTSATINGRIRNNTDVQVKSNVGSNVGSGIRANINKNATAKLEISGNTVNVGSDDAGIDLSAIGKTTANPGGGTNTLDATVTGNNVTIGATSTYGIIILSATNAGDTNALCANVASNAITRNPSSISSFRARVPSATGFFRMEGFTTNAEATWNAKSNTPTSAGGSEVSFGGSGTFAACTAALPTNPVLN